MSYTNHIILCCLVLACCSFFIIFPAHAFTANSLDIVIDKSGDATATFRFTLEGFIENAIPESVLQEELVKGLTTSSDPPQLLSMDKSGAVLLMKKFADMSDVPTGTEYRTATMDFKKAEIALQNSGLSSAVTADFSPAKITLTFPDSYKREFTNVDVLPAVFHTVIDPSKTPRATAAPSAGGVPGAPLPGSGETSATGSLNVTSSPTNVKVYLDSVFIGEAPSIFPNIAPGTHFAEFRKEGYETSGKNVTINSGKITPVLVVLRYIPSAAAEDNSSPPWIPLLLVVIGLAVIAVGGYFYWTEKKKKEWGGEGDTGTDRTGNRDTARRSVKNIPGVSQPLPKDTVAKNTVVRDIVIRDIGDQEKAINNTAVDAVPGNTVVRTTELRGQPASSPVLKDTGARKKKHKDTVVRTSSLNNIPAKDTEKTGSGDKPE